MASRRSNIKRTIAPALVLMALVFVLSYHLPSSGSQEESRDLDTSARAQLEKELAIHKPRTRITVSAEHGRSVQMLHSREVPKDSESRRPLERALYAYLEAYRTTVRAGKHVATESKVLVYTPGVVGWGNRVQGLYLSMAMALLTNRTLLVDWTSPIPLSELVSLNPSLDLLLDSNKASRINKLPSINANAWDHPRGYSNFAEDVLKNLDIPTAWDAPVVHFSVGEDWMSHLLQNVHMKDDITRVFGTFSARPLSERNLQLLAHELLSFLIVDMSPAAQSYLAQSSIYSSFYGDAKDTSLESLPIIVGVQIRIGTNNTSFEPFVDLEKDVPKFWVCVDNILKNKPNSKIFLATDSAVVKKRALERFDKGQVLFFEGPIVHSGNEQVTDEHGKGRSLEGLLKVVVDWWLLGDSQYLLRSRQSTFGRSAAVRRPTASMVLPTQFEDGCPLR